MRHRVDHRKLGRPMSHRLAMLNNLAVALVRHGRIQTTLPRAKELRRVADRLVTWGKRGTLAARRRARGLLQDRESLARLFNDLVPRFANRNGGYTRILKLNFRQGDQSPLALVEYVDNPPPVAKAVKGAAKRKEGAPAKSPPVKKPAKARPAKAKSAKE